MEIRKCNKCGEIKECNKITLQMFGEIVDESYICPACDKKATDKVFERAIECERIKARNRGLTPDF